MVSSSYLQVAFLYYMTERKIWQGKEEGFYCILLYGRFCSYSPFPSVSENTSLFVYILAHLEFKVNIFTYNRRATYAPQKRSQIALSTPNSSIQKA